MKLGRRGVLTAFAVLALSCATPAYAGGGANCTLSATPLSFGKYVPFSGSPADFTATVTVTCTASSATPVAINGTIGLSGAGGASGRQLSAGAARLRYQLYLDPARTVPWGDAGSSDAMTFSNIVGPTAPFRQTFTVYGRILARQSNASVGNYNDHIAVMLYY
jgi:spore coat protein U-like protein